MDVRIDPARAELMRLFLTVPQPPSMARLLPSPLVVCQPGRLVSYWVAREVRDQMVAWCEEYRAEMGWS